MEDLIGENTLYYFFSTIAQVLAATTALISIAIQFKVSNIKRHLIGDGQATYGRALSEDKGYKLENKYLNRLRDSLGREDLDGIEEVLKVLHDTEENEGFTEKQRPRGLQYLYKRFQKMRSQLDSLKSIIHDVVLISLISIVISIIFLGLVDLLDKYPTFEILTMSITFLLVLLSFWKTYLGIKKGLE